MINITDKINNVFNSQHRSQLYWQLRYQLDDQLFWQLNNQHWQLNNQLSNLIYINHD
jgi:hypothetical protein